MLFSLSPNVGVLVGEAEGVGTSSLDYGQHPSVRDNVPVKGEGHILVPSETVSIIPEVIVGVHVLEIQVGILTSLDDLVPENNLGLKTVSIYGTTLRKKEPEWYLIQLVVCSLVFSYEEDKQLLGIPVEEGVQVGLQVEHEVAKILLLLLCAVVWNIFPARNKEGYKRAVLMKSGRQLTYTNTLTVSMAAVAA